MSEIICSCMFLGWSACTISTEQAHYFARYHGQINTTIIERMSTDRPMATPNSHSAERVEIQDAKEGLVYEQVEEDS